MGNEVAVVGREQQSVSAFGAGAEGFETAQRIAKALASSTLVPDAYRNNLPNVLVAMELANRIGASVFAVMQNMDVIHGRPGLRATFLIATVNASGRFTPLRFRWEGDEGTDTWGCRCTATDRESGEACDGALITIDLAKAEGWYNRNGSKWKTIPEQMLMYRAAAFWTRVYCPELSLGMRTSDELEDVAAEAPARAQVAAAALDAEDEIPNAEFTVQTPTAQPEPEAEREPGTGPGEGPEDEPAANLFDQAEQRTTRRGRAQA